MEKVTVKKRTVTTIFYQSEKVPEGMDIELELTPANDSDVFVTETDYGFKVGYLITDEFANNPLEECGGIGIIHHHPRSSYGSRNSEYYSVLGLDNDGDPVIDEAKVQAMWHDMIMSLPLELFALPEDEAWEGHETQLREQLADEEAGDFTMTQQCKHAWHAHWLCEGTIDKLVSKLEEAISWDYEIASEECRAPANPDVIMLDLYDHSGCIWSISGTGMNCPWDTSRHESVWVPDEVLLNEVEGKSPEDREAYLLKTCKEALNMYNAWSSGQVYEVVIQKHDFDGKQLSYDYVDYAYGRGDAEESLKEAIK